MRPTSDKGRRVRGPMRAEHAEELRDLRAENARLQAGEPDELVERMSALADEIMKPLECVSPAYGVPGYAHCAACCYGKGYVVTCDAEQAMVDAASALNRAAALIRASSQPAGYGASRSGLTRPLRAGAPHGSRYAQ